MRATVMGLVLGAVSILSVCYAEDMPALSAEQQEALLGKRLSGEMSFSMEGKTVRDFENFSRVFVGMSHADLGHEAILLETDSEKIRTAELRSPFPDFYKPTLREFLDAIAAHTFSRWKLDPHIAYIPGSAGVYAVKFTEAAGDKPYEITLAPGWTAEDQGSWVMYAPPNFPVGMDIYEVGTYSSDDKTKQEELFQRVKVELALRWAKVGRLDATPEKMIKSKVGIYDALFFEGNIQSKKDTKEIKWRQWVFMVKDRAYFIVSTINADLDGKIYSDVESMLKSFRAR